MAVMGQIRGGTVGGGDSEPIAERQNSVSFTANVNKTITLTNVRKVAGGFVFNSGIPKYFAFYYDGTQWQTWQTGSGFQFISASDYEVVLKYDGSYSFDVIICGVE